MTISAPRTNNTSPSDSSPMAEQLLLGVDGGNTKTIALVARPDGSIVGAGRAGCSDIFNAPSEADALFELDAAVSEALTAAGIGPQQIAYGAFGLAGADWPEDTIYLETHIRKRGYGQRVSVTNDAIPALRAGTDDGVGVVISYGTGLAAAARNASGQSWHSGFWAEPLGGGRMGHDALNQVLRSELGIAPATNLRAALLAHFGHDEVATMLRAVFGHDRPALSERDYARLAPAVLNCAHAGDDGARSIVDEHARKLAEYALAAARQVGMHPPHSTLVLNGGLFRDEARTLQSVLERYLPTANGFALTRLGEQPVVGAVLMAFDGDRMTATAEIRSRMIATSEAYLRPDLL